MQSVEFSDIRIRAVLPLHPYLAKHPHLFLRLVADECVCGDTAGVNGDLVTGVWDFKGRLYAHLFKQYLTVTVLTGVNGPGIQVVSITLRVAELLAREKAFPNCCQEFEIFDSGKPIQLKLFMTSAIKLSTILGRSSKATVHTINSRTRGAQSSMESGGLALPSRGDLESLYAKIIQMPDDDGGRARDLGMLGLAYHALYLDGAVEGDLNKAISMHEEALQCSGPFHPQLADHTHQLSLGLTLRYENTRNISDIERAISYLQTALRFTEDIDEKMPDRLNNLGTAFQLRFNRTGDLADIEGAISNQQRALKRKPCGHPSRPVWLSNLGAALRSRFHCLGNLADLEEAINNLRQGVGQMLDGNSEKPGHLDSLGNALESRFDRLGSLKDLEDAISTKQRAVNLTPDRHPERLGQLGNLGKALITRFERLGDLVDLERAIKNFELAIQLAPGGHPEEPTLFDNLGTAFRLRFDRIGDLADIESAISNQQRAIKLTPHGDLSRPARLNNLGTALKSRFERLGTLNDMEDAIENFRKVIELTPDGHPNQPIWFGNLGTALGSRFGRLGNLADLEEAISNQQKAVKLTPDGHPVKPGRLNDLGLTLEARFERLGNLRDLENAIWNFQQAVGLTPDDSPQAQSRLNHLGSALGARFWRLGNLKDLEDAILSLRKVIELMPDGHPDNPARFDSLGRLLESRFKRTGSLMDLEDAISNKLRAVELTPDDRPDKPSWLNSLGDALESRFDHLGNIVDLEDAISIKRKAVDLTPEDHPDKPARLSYLGNALNTRFHRMGSITDLEDAISNKQRAVDLIPDGHIAKPSLLSNLGLALESKFDRLDTLEDLEDAIENIQKAVELTPDGHFDQPSWLSNLGAALETRFRRLGNLNDLENAIKNSRKAVKLAPDGHRHRVSALNNLSLALRSRFSHLKNLSDLEESIFNLRKVLELTPNGHPDNPGCLINLGNAFLTRHNYFNILADLESALSSYSTAAKSNSGSAMVRFKAAHIWAKVSEKNSRSPLDAFGCAIDLLPRIAWLGLAVTDQHALLADVGGIVRDAVASAIKYEEYETAIVWAEQGRSIVWQNMLGLRSPVEDLRESHPDLANRLRNIALQLEGPGFRDVAFEKKPIVSAWDDSPNYSKLATQWDEVIDEIRKIPNFEGFLRAKSFSQLCPAAHEGPVVILNANDKRCDALALVVDESVGGHVSAINIPLEFFSHEQSKKIFQTLTELLSSAGVRERNDRKSGRFESQAEPEAEFKLILRMLWQDVVKPVIESLAFPAGSNRPPRIWWCATGLLAFLPLHAAGLYDTEEIGEKVSDYVVSSYTPTLSSILELSNPVVREDFQVLTVAQASAPGAQFIPKTEDEVQIVHDLTIGVRRVNLTRENATVERVREEMIESNWIHLACHGQQNQDNPMESGFLLHDKILKLSEIVKMTLPKADFAFLSACQTAMGDETIAEESVHLAAGLLLSGCRGVIATTWSIRDEDAPSIAEDVYGRIFKDGSRTGRRRHMRFMKQ